MRKDIKDSVWGSVWRIAANDLNSRVEPRARNSVWDKTWSRAWLKLEERLNEKRH